RHAGALGSGQRAGDVEALLRQQVVEVVARHAAGDVRVALAHLVAEPVAQLGQLRVDLIVAGGALAQGQPPPVVEQYVELVDVVRGARTGPVELRHYGTDNRSEEHTSELQS